MKFPFHIRETADLDVVGFGTNAVDHLIVVREYPQFNSKVDLIHYEKAAGGEVATTIVGLQRLGLRTAYAGHFGNDEEGKFGLESLLSEGVDTSYCETVMGATTQLAFIIVDQATGERTIIWKRDERLAYTAETAPVEAASRCRVLHMTPHDVAACVRMAKIARDNSAIVSLDIDKVFDGVEELLPLADIVIASSEFPAKLTGNLDLADALHAIQEKYGSPVVGATLGNNGSVIACNGREITTSAYAVPGGCRDTTGAGDAFRTGFLFAMLAGEAVSEAARHANATAALKCRSSGARSGLPTVKELTTLLQKA